MPDDDHPVKGRIGPVRRLGPAQLLSQPQGRVHDRPAGRVDEDPELVTRRERRVVLEFVDRLQERHRGGGEAVDEHERDLVRRVRTEHEQARLDLRPELRGDHAADRLGREPVLRRLQRQMGRAVGRQRQGTPAGPGRTDPERVVEDQAERRQPVGPACQPAAGRGQHGRRDPEPTREELLIRLGRVVAVDATRADDRNPQSASPEPVPHPGNLHVGGHHDFGEPPRVNERIAPRRHDPEPGQGPATSSGPRRRVHPARSGRAGPRRRCGHGRRGRSTRPPGRPGPAPRRRPPRARRNSRGRVVARLPQGGAIPQLGKGERDAGFTLGAGR